VLDDGTAEVEDTSGVRRAEIDGFTLVVDQAGAAVLNIPADRKVAILTQASCNATQNLQTTPAEHRFRPCRQRASGGI
jgi:hypothetical protein